MRNSESEILCNEKFLRIVTCSESGGSHIDPKGADIYLEPLSDCKVVGESLLKAFSKSRDLSLSEEDRQALIAGKVSMEWINKKYPENLLFTPVAEAARYKEWIPIIMKNYEYKTKTALMKNMQNVFVANDGEFILFSSWYHLTNESWGDPDGKTPSVEMKISADSSVAVIGAAVRYAIGNCQGKGSDFMRNLLFPEGKPGTFEEYLEQLGF